MGLIPRFTARDVESMTAQCVVKIEQDIVQILEYCGEMFVKDARDGLNISGAFPKGDYKDRTANLRSSIGYFVVSDGQIIASGLGGNSEGIAAARRAFGRIPKSGYQLIGVAGMDYASHVESMGYNVITSQQDIILIDLKDMLKDYQRRMNEKGVNVGFDIAGSLGAARYRS